MDLSLFFETLAMEWQLGALLDEPVTVSGGYLHKMYRLHTTAGCFAVKLLNPEIMKRETAMSNYRRAEVLEAVLEKNGLPIVAALMRNGEKMHCIQGQYYYLFPWVEGKALPPDGITGQHCAVIGGLLARMHTLPTPENQLSEPEPFSFAWEALADKAREKCPAIAKELCAALPLLSSAQAAYNEALKDLPPLCAICNGDMDAKNVLWQDGQPMMIDLECLEIGNPAYDLIVLALSWSGGAECALDTERLLAFAKAYRAIHSVGELNWHALSGLGFSWLDWLHYSVRRACGLEGADDAQRQLGIAQTLETLGRIRYYACIRETVAQCLCQSLQTEM